MKLNTLKKICCATAASILLGSNLAINAPIASAAYIEDYTTTWGTGTFNKTYHKERFQKTTTSGKATLAYMANSYHWNGGKYAASGTYSIAQNKTCSSTNSVAVASNVGLSVAPEGIGISSSFGITETNSRTTSYGDTQTYSETYTRESPAGYYTWEARIDFEKWKTDTWKRNTKNADWDYLGYGYAFTFKSVNPYFEVGYTTFSVN